MLHIATRFFGKNAKNDLPRIETFVQKAKELGRVHVAINQADDTTDTIGYISQLGLGDVDIFGVTPWQKFVAPLNALVYRASQENCTRLLIASAEFPPDESIVSILTTHMDDDTLVVGARFSEHDFHEGTVVGTGTSVPWNTFALWNMSFLARIGFPLVGDGPFDLAAGVEEVAAIAVQQQLFGCSAKLVSIPGFFTEWNMDGWDEARRLKHAQKIASKIDRPRAQLKWAHLEEPLIIHIHT